MACSLVGGSVSVSSRGPRLVDYVGLLLVSLNLWLLQSLPPFFHKIPHAMPDVWLWVSASVSICCWMRLATRQVMLTSCLQALQSIIDSVRDSLALSSEVGLELGQSLIGYSLNLCSIFTLVPLVGMTKFGLKVLWVGWCPLASFSVEWKEAYLCCRNHNRPRHIIKHMDRSFWEKTLFCLTTLITLEPFR